MTGINIDKTAPVYGTPVRASGSEANADGWNKGDVTVNFPCTDALSGQVTDPVVKTLTTEGANQTATALATQCVDKAGNHAAGDATLSGISIDKTAPTITYASRTPVPNDNGWNNANVTLTWNCADTLSQPVSAAVSKTVSTEGSNQSSTGTCTDKSGNTASNTQTGVYIDKTKPTLSPVVTPDPSLLNGTATSSAGATDVLSGTESQSCPAPNLATVGTKTLTCTATDKAGNTETKAIIYKVQYATGTCLGVLGHAILQPINLDGSSVFKKGSTVPAKFRVCDAHGASVSTAGVVSSFYRLASIPGVPGTVNEDVISTTPDTAFRWSATDSLWIFNVSTKDPSLSPNAEYVYRISLNDGTSIDFTFGLR
jgi:hypothetical protein